MNKTSKRSGRPPVWRGTAGEAGELLTAALNHCTCVLDDHGARVKMCPSHSMVFTDQRALNGLLFARRTRARFEAAEFDAPRPAPLSAD
jgi:hypothetical protein